LNDKCSSADDCLSKGMNDKVYKIIKRFFSEHKNRLRFIKSSDEKLITIISDEEEKLKTWKDYIEILYEN